MNIYQMYTNVISNLLIGNIGTLQAHNKTLDIYTEASQQLTANWTTNPEKGTAISKALDGVKDNSDMNNFLNTYLTKGYLYEFSQSFGIAVMQKLNQKGVWDKDNSPSQMNIINQFISLISSTGQNEEQIGQNETKTEGSVVQQDGSAQQSLADTGNTVNGTGGNIAGLLQQTY